MPIKHLYLYNHHIALWFKHFDQNWHYVTYIGSNWRKDQNGITRAHIVPLHCSLNSTKGFKQQNTKFLFLKLIATNNSCHSFSRDKVKNICLHQLVHDRRMSIDNYEWTVVSPYVVYSVIVYFYKLRSVGIKIRIDQLSMRADIGKLLSFSKYLITFYMLALSSSVLRYFTYFFQEIGVDVSANCQLRRQVAWNCMHHFVEI